MRQINLHKGLLRYLKNRRRHDGLPCEKVVSNTRAVQAFATFWDNNFEDIEAAMSHLLHEWEANNDYTKEESICYKQGLASLTKFMMKCSAETENKK